MHVYNLGHGEQLVKAARNCVELFIMNPRFNKALIIETLEGFEKRHGVFVTLEHYPTSEPRGSMGFARPVAPLSESLVDATIAAAFEDPAHVPVSKPELEHMIVRVNVLSTPVQVKGGEGARLKAIKVPRDGLMIEYGLRSGTILPIVAYEKKWDKKRLLEETSKRAGLHSDYWMQPNVKLFRFESQVFAEESPYGRIIEVNYDKD